MSGQKKLRASFDRYVKKVTEQQTEKAVTMLLIQIQLRSATMVPVATGNLINSEFRRAMPTMTGWSGEVGYGAEYAKLVHDAPGSLIGKSQLRDKERPSLGNVWDPNAEPKFLQKGAWQAINLDWPKIKREVYR